MNQKDNKLVTPLYISLKIHDWKLHNLMLDLGSSHNLIPKETMDKIGLEITREYKYLYYFYSRRVLKCLG